MKIKALRMFSHYHLGTVSQGETRIVKKEIGEALVKLLLAEEVDAEPVRATNPEPPPKAKTGGKSGAKRRADGTDKESSQG